ncbi:MAG: 3-ketoacyl-ACP reductase [Clostridia bacterium]|nr:3-ketoacyl-ACP reductase [Clostridia bacterium]MBR2908609.1 3-ketoacyl-ACP reductase [Clostridia bacterium]
MKIAIVTGVLGGIGKESALQLCRAGYAVVGMDVVEPQDLSAFDGFDFTYVRGDLSSAESRTALVNAATEKGELAALVNVAGVAPKVRRDILEMTEESYDFVMGINTKGTLFLTQAVANEMVKRGNGGAIVNISSCSAYTSSTSRGEYCISKAGVSMITKLFADRLASDGITVNEICPGIIATGMTATVKEKYDRLIADGLVPLGRWGQPDDIAKAVVALCDGTFGYTTGQSFILDGGMHIRRL